MARDVEFNITADDKTGTALAEAEAKFKASQERIRKESKKTGDSVGDNLKKGVDKSSLGIADKLKSTFGVAGTSGGELLAIGLTAASPVIGAVISAAIIGGVGAGGVIGGVYLAAKDPRVQAAGSALGKNLMGQLQQDADVFVDPILKNIGKVEGRFDQMNGRIKNIFSNSSGFLDPLVDGVLDGVDGVLRGVDVLVAKAGPVMKSLGKSFGIVGDDIGDALEIVSGDSEDAASALTNLAKAGGALIKTGAYLIRGLTELYGVISYIPGKAKEAELGLAGFVGINENTQTAVAGTATSTAAAAIAIARAGEAATAAVPPVRDLDKEWRDATEAARSLYGATTDLAGATATANATLKENGKTHDLNTKKGRENRAALIDVAGAMVREHDAAVAANGEGVKSATISEKNRIAFIKLAEKAGYSATQAKALATSIGLIPTRRETEIRADTAQAEAKAKNVKTLLDQVRSKTVSVSVLINAGRLDNIENRLNRLGGSMYNSLGSSFAAGDRNSGVARTGGPTPVSVNNSFGVYINGVMDRRSTVQVVDERSARDAWRQKVGRRK